MDSLTVLFLIILISSILTVPLILILLNGTPPLPGPSLRDYLPGGLVQDLVRDSRVLRETMLKLQHRYGEVFHIWLGLKRVVVTSNREDVAQVLSAATDFLRSDAIRATSGIVAPGGLFATDGSIHKDMKQRLRDSFNPSMLESFHRPMTDAARELCDSIAQSVGKGGVDLSCFFAETTFQVLCDVAFAGNMERGKRLEITKDVSVLIDQIMQEVLWYPARQRLTLFGFREKFFRCNKKILDSCLVIIKRRLSETRQQKESRRADILDAILEISGGDAVKASGLTIEFTIAGSHTSSQTLLWALYELCCEPRVIRELYRELDTVIGHKPLNEPLTLEDIKNLKYVTQIWRETLRIHPSGSSMLRVATRDIKLKGSGVCVKKGTEVHGLLGLCQIDPELWQNPLEFRPERWEEGKESEGSRALPGSYMPFGVGTFACLGKFLADYEGPLLIAELYRRFLIELDCKPKEVVTRSGFVETARFLKGKREMAVPFKVSMRNE